MPLRLAASVMLAATLCSSGGQIDRSARAPSEPLELALEVVSVDESEHGTVASLTLRNTGAASAWFPGHGPGSPIYSVEVLTDGQWVPQPLGWCGVGMKMNEVAPEGSARFRIPVNDPSATYRVVLNACHRDDPETANEYEVVRSRSFTPRDESRTLTDEPT